MSELGDKIEVPIEGYKEHQDMLTLSHTLLKGTQGMREAGVIYLPAEEGESTEKYRARLARSTLFNAFQKTISKLVGEVFAKDISLDKDVALEIQGFCENIDLRGNSINAFSKKVFEAGIVDGVTHILIDYPKINAKTKAEAKKQGARPYWIHVKAKDLIGWRFKSVSGKPVLCQIRIREAIEVPQGRFGVKMVERIRLIEPNYYEVWEKSENGTWVIALDPETLEPLQGATTASEIPLVTFITGRLLTQMTARPSLEDLAGLNCQHWQSSSDQRNILHYARLVTYFGKMLDVDDDGKVIFGANRLIHSHDPQADLKVVEPQGQAIASGRQDLKDLEGQMALFGLSLLMPKTGQATATEKAIDSAENDSTLKGWGQGFKDTLENALLFTARWMGQTVGGSVVVNTDFKTALRDQDADILLRAFQMNIVSREVVIEELSRRGIISQEIDMLDLLAQLAKDAQNTPSLTGLSGSFEMPGQTDKAT